MTPFERDAAYMQAHPVEWAWRRFTWAVRIAAFTFGAVVFILGPHAQVDGVTEDGYAVIEVGQ